MLEIYADDVKCNHGSTIGKLDEQALFYMRQRGIPEAEARLLLQHAFINEVLRHVQYLCCMSVWRIWLICVSEANW